MARFTDNITQEGERMLAKAVAGEKITFTKVVVGSGEIPSGKDVKTMTSLISPVKEVDVQSVTLNSSNTVLVSAYFTNKDITEGFYFREKGIYMSDGTDEVLGIYGNCGADADYIDKSDNFIIERLLKNVIDLTDQEKANINIEDYIYEYSPTLEPNVTSISDFVKTPAALAMKEGQRVILNNKKAYTYVGKNPRNIECYIAGTVSVRAGDTLKTANAGPYLVKSQEYAMMARSYTEGDTGIRENENIDCAKYYYQQLKDVAGSIAGETRYCGSILSADIPDASKELPGNMYNVENEFTTTEEFLCGAGFSVPAGINIYVTTDGKWDCMAGIYEMASSTKRGLVKLSDSDAITTAGEFALDAIEKNASVDGTMANQIAQLNTDFDDLNPTLYKATTNACSGYCDVYKIGRICIASYEFTTTKDVSGFTTLGLFWISPDVKPILKVFSPIVSSGTCECICLYIPTNDSDNSVYLQPNGKTISAGSSFAGTSVWVTK